MERRGGFRIDPVKQRQQPLDQAVKRRAVSSLRGVYTNPDGTVDTDDWHEVGASGEPTFQNSWVNNGGSWATAAFRRYGDGMVEIKGLVKSGTIGTVSVFTLPTGFRPALGLHFAAISNNAIGTLQVLADGSVMAVAGSNVWFSLQCTFAAEA